MSDREMLEFAAKAAGMNVSWDHYDPDYCAGAEGMFLNGERSPDNSKYWNPLADDGDALRLMVGLGLKLNVCVTSGSAQVGGIGTFVEVEFDGDPLAATRRAITRAAAEIGRQMP